MLQTRLTRPDHLGAVDLRADSPMREEASILNGSTLNGGRPPALPKPFGDASANGFTAVNGEAHRIASFRPDEALRPITLPPVDFRGNGVSEQSSRPASYQSHGWRPTDARSSIEHTPERPGQSPETNKRKRTLSPSGLSRGDVRERQPRDASPHAPKRRETAHDGGVVSPEPTYADERDRDGPEDAQPGTYVRELTPVFRAEHRTPPPQPRPEVAAALAQSVQQQFGPVHKGSTSDSPPNEQDGRPQSPPPAGDQAQNEPDDPKKGRKRNFSNRTKTGCHTCRARKKKCDESKPMCNNCIRGSFTCGGYGAKPAGNPKLNVSRAVVPLQAKHYEPPHGPNHYFDASYHEAHPRSLPPYTPDRFALPRPDVHEPHGHRYSGPIPPMDSRPPHEREVWGPTRPIWHPGSEHPSHSILHQRLPHADYPGVPPPPAQPFAQLPPLPISADPWQPSLQPQASWPQQATAAATVITDKSSSSGSGNGSHRGQYILPAEKDRAPNQQNTERLNMISGRKYKPYLDERLRTDRRSCRQALESWNETCIVKNNVSSGEQERQFKGIQDPRERPKNGDLAWEKGPVGTCGHHTVVESPFNCDYGYNLHFGSDVVIDRNCYMQDASFIIIGSRTIIGPNVKFYCMTASVDAAQRNGTRGDFIAGPIKVEEDVFIGADSIILPFRTIGKGAVVGAGSVVTRDVKPYTVVAGNPAKQVRKRKISPGPSADRHNDDIQEQNDEMLRKLQANELLPEPH